MKTRWYPKNVKPVREGWYEAKCCNGFMQCGGLHLWRDNHWFFYEYPCENLPWRGLKK